MMNTKKSPYAEVLIAKTVFIPYRDAWASSNSIGVLRAGCPHCQSFHIHGWTGQHICASCGEQYIVEGDL